MHLRCLQLQNKLFGGDYEESFKIRHDSGCFITFVFQDALQNLIKKSGETVSEFKDEDIVLGEVVDGVYTSKMLDLKV